MNIQAAIEEAIRETGERPMEINNGNCDSFTLRVIELMGGYSNDLTDGATDIDSHLLGHYWIEYRGRYYDSECPQGVDNWRDLPLFIGK